MIGNVLRQAFPKPPICNVTIADLCEQVATLSDLQQVVEDNFRALDDAICSTFNQHALIPYAGLKDVVLMEALGDASLMDQSQEGLVSGFRNALLSLKNFFLNLWASVVAFFKQMFDKNSKVRTSIINLQREFDKTRSLEGDERITKIPLYLPSYKDAEDVIANLEILYADATELSKLTTIQQASIFKRGITKFGYIVKDGVIYDYKPYQIQASKITMVTSDWDIENFKTISERVGMLCTNAGKLNALKDSLENDVTSATRAIDKYIVLGDESKAQQLQYELNNKSLRSSYVFKCAIVFQSYVTQMSGMIIDAWNNILAAN